MEATTHYVTSWQKITPRMSEVFTQIHFSKSGIKENLTTQTGRTRMGAGTNAIRRWVRFRLYGAFLDEAEPGIVPCEMAASQQQFSRNEMKI